MVVRVSPCRSVFPQMEAQADAFEKEGGFTERLYRVRSQRRNDRAKPPNDTAFGGEGGIRTPGARLEHTAFPVPHLRPLGHLSHVKSAVTLQ